MKRYFFVCVSLILPLLLEAVESEELVDTHEQSLLLKAPLIQQKISTSFMDFATQRLKDLKAGNPLNTSMSTLFSPELFSKVMRSASETGPKEIYYAEHEDFDMMTDPEDSFDQHALKRPGIIWYVVSFSWLWGRQ